MKEIIKKYWQYLKDREELGRLLIGKHYPTDKGLDKLLSKIMELGIDNFKEGTHYITFNCNGVACKLWDANKYHAWLKEGQIGSYKWSDDMPGYSVMVKFKRFIEPHRQAKKEAECQRALEQLES